MRSVITAVIKLHLGRGLSPLKMRAPVCFLFFTSSARQILGLIFPIDPSSIVCACINAGDSFAAISCVFARIDFTSLSLFLGVYT